MANQENAAENISEPEAESSIGTEGRKYYKNSISRIKFSYPYLSDSETRYIAHTRATERLALAEHCMRNNISLNEYRSLAQKYWLDF